MPVARADGTANLIRRGILAEPDVSVYPKIDVLDREFRNSLVHLYDSCGGHLHECVPVLQRSSIFSIVRYTDCQSSVNVKSAMSSNSHFSHGRLLFILRSFRNSIVFLCNFRSA